MRYENPQRGKVNKIHLRPGVEILGVNDREMQLSERRLQWTHCLADMLG